MTFRFGCYGRRWWSWPVQLVAPLICADLDVSGLDPHFLVMCEVRATVDQRLGRLLQRLPERRALGYRPAVRGRVEDLTGELNLPPLCLTA